MLDGNGLLSLPDCPWVPSLETLWLCNNDVENLDGVLCQVILTRLFVAVIVVVVVVSLTFAEWQRGMGWTGRAHIPIHEWLVVLLCDVRDVTVAALPQNPWTSTGKRRR